MAVAGAAVLLGRGGGTSAEVQGAPLEAARTAGPVAPKHTQATLAELLDLDRVTLAPAGDHYEAQLKDGRRAQLTLVPDLQAYAEKLLTEARAPRGAIVAMAPDGRILALAGRRSEPELPRGVPGATKPRYTRTGTSDWRLATDVWAPAASVFKLVTASALVAAGVDPSDKVCFHGGIRSVLESNLRDDKRDSRCENLTYGVAHSNNAILGKLAFQKLDPAGLSRTAKVLGIAQGLPGTEVPGVAGAIDLPAMRDLQFARAAAGFSGSHLSAVGGALLAATFADDGEQPVPRIIASIDGVAVPAPARRRAVSPEVARAVGRMMMATCESGSAAKSFGRRQGVRAAGKTGTLTRNEPFYMEHSWFVGYAPAEQPQIVVSVVLGNPESWYLRGHEAARRLIDRAIEPARARNAEPAKARAKDRARKKRSSKRVG